MPIVDGQGGLLAWYIFGVVWIGVAQLVTGELESTPSFRFGSGSAIGAVLIVVLLTRQALRRHKHRRPAE